MVWCERAPVSSGMRLVLAKLPHFFRGEQHIAGGDSALPAVSQVQITVAAGDVVGGGKTEQARGPVDPTRVAFDLHIVTDRRFIQQHLAGAGRLRIFGAELLVAKDGMIADLVEDLLHFEGIRQHHFNLVAFFVASLLGRTFVGEQCVGAHAAHADQLSMAAQRAAGGIQQNVVLVQPALGHAEPEIAQGAPDLTQVSRETQFDLDFERHGFELMVEGPAFYESRSGAAVTSRNNCFMSGARGRTPLYWTYGGFGQTGSRAEAGLRNPEGEARPAVLDSEADAARHHRLRS